MDRQRFEDGLKKIGATWQGTLPEIRRIVDNTQEIKPGDLFVLRQGANPLSAEQIKKYCTQAIEAGAICILTDPGLCIEVQNVPVIHLSEPHHHLGEIAEAFYGSPSKKMKMIAVTGTNGKTTTTYLIESLAKAMGLKVGVLGTISYRYPGYEEPSLNTTPGTLKLYRLLHEMSEAGCELVAMEVSSHGIVQGRIDGVLFDAAIWNNLGTDHLDFHKTREEYGLAKQHLFDKYLKLSFEEGKKPVAVGNADDAEVMGHLFDANPANWGGEIRTFSLESSSGANLIIQDYFLLILELLT